MKRMILLLFLIGFAGCISGENVLENPGIFQDSLYTDYKKTADVIEARYLNKEISYADYLQKKQELEDWYKKEADKRRSIIQGQ